MTVRIIVEAEADQALKVLGQVINDITGMGESTKRTTKEATGFMGMVRKMRDVGLAAQGTMFMIQGTTRAIGEFVEGGVDIGRTRWQFEELAGGAAIARAALDEMRVATKHTVSDFDLMQLGVSALNLGFVEGADGLAEFARIANIIQMTSQPGVNALNEMTLAMANMSERRFDQLNLDLGHFNEIVDGMLARSEGLSKADVWQPAFWQLITERAQQMGGIMDEAVGGGIDTAKAKWDNFWGGMKEGIAILADDLLNTLVPAIEDVSQALGIGMGEMQEWADSALVARDVLEDIARARELGLEIDPDIERVLDAVKAGLVDITEVAPAIAALPQFEDLQASIERTEAEMAELAATTEQLIQLPTGEFVKTTTRALEEMEVAADEAQRTAALLDKALPTGLRQTEMDLDALAESYTQLGIAMAGGIKEISELSEDLRVARFEAEAMGGALKLAADDAGASLRLARFEGEGLAATLKMQMTDAAGGIAAARAEVERLQSSLEAALGVETTGLAEDLFEQLAGISAELDIQLGLALDTTNEAEIAFDELVATLRGAAEAGEISAGQYVNLAAALNELLASGNASAATLDAINVALDAGKPGLATWVADTAQAKINLDELATAWDQVGMAMSGTGAPGKEGETKGKAVGEIFEKDGVSLFGETADALREAVVSVETIRSTLSQPLEVVPYSAEALGLAESSDEAMAITETLVPLAETPYSPEALELDRSFDAAVDLNAELALPITKQVTVIVTEVPAGGGAGGDGRTDRY